jgi:endogenous inhibitor of DNA gyrase (YacG/DUF329 family)
MTMQFEVSCPRCKSKTVYSEQNPFRPFCSERCRLIDFGSWANGSYAIADLSTVVDEKSTLDGDSEAKRPQEEPHD